jgi:hypothetical protein
MTDTNHTCPKCGSTSMIYTDPMYCSKCNYRMPGGGILMRSSPNPDRMEPGPEMDRLVAQALLNYRPDGAHTCMGVIDAGSWHPSRRMSDAWDLVLKMKDLGHRPLIQSSEDGKEWTANFPTQNETGDLCWRHESSRSTESAQLAITRAALKALTA